LGPTNVVPVDVHLHITIVREIDGKPTFRAKKVLWDYDKEELVEVGRATYALDDVLDDAGRWTIRRIVSGGGGGKAEVHIKDSLDPLQKIRIKQGKKRDVAGWPPLIAGAGDAAVAEEPAAAEEVKASAKASAKAPSKKRTTKKKRRRTFK
jgi:hypothetical protein